MKTDKDITSPEAVERLAITLEETNNWETEAHIKLSIKAEKIGDSSRVLSGSNGETNSVTSSPSKKTKCLPLGRIP